jgi:uncharacterized membrane protein
VLVLALKLLTLQGAPYIYDIIRLRVKDKTSNLKAYCILNSGRLNTDTAIIARPVTGIQLEWMCRVTCAQYVEVAVHQKLLYTPKLFVISVIYLPLTAKSLINSNNSDRNTSCIDKMK